MDYALLTGASTYGASVIPDPDFAAALCRAFWPHWDWDDPATTFPKLPERLHQRVFAENARELFGLL